MISYDENDISRLEAELKRQEGKLQRFVLAEVCSAMKSDRFLIHCTLYDGHGDSTQHNLIVRWDRETVGSLKGAIETALGQINLFVSEDGYFIINSSCPI